MARHVHFALQLKGQRREIEKDISFLKNTHAHNWLINFLLKFCVELKQGGRQDCRDGAKEGRGNQSHVLAFAAGGGVEGARELGD